MESLPARHNRLRRHAAQRPAPTPNLHDYVAEILRSAGEAVKAVDCLRRVTRLEEADTGLPGRNVINLARSVGDGHGEVPGKASAAG